MSTYLDRLKETQNLKTSNVATAKTAKSLFAVNAVPSSGVSEGSATLFAVNAVPNVGVSENSSGLLHANDESVPRWTVARAEQVTRWLEHIGETHPDIIREVLDRCRDNPDARAFFIGRAERELPKPDAPGTTRVTVAIPGKAAADLAVPADRVIDFCKEAKRRGLLVRYKLRGSKTVSTVMAGPGDTTEALRQRLSDEFGERIAFEPEGAA